MSRERSKAIEIDVAPVVLDDVIESMPPIVVNCRSSGLATAEAIVTGSAPGRLAFTVMLA